MDSNYLHIDYHHIPCKAKIYQKGTLVKKWNVENPLDLVHAVIDGMDVSGFEKIKLKKTIEETLKVFEPKNIKIVEKEKHE